MGTFLAIAALIVSVACRFWDAPYKGRSGAKSHDLREPDWVIDIDTTGNVIGDSITDITIGDINIRFAEIQTILNDEAKRAYQALLEMSNWTATTDMPPEELGMDYPPPEEFDI